jgi:Fic family protein
MDRRIGSYITQKVPGESYQAYLPIKLPPHPLALEPLLPELEKATHALAELNSVTGLIPNPELFIYIYVRKEALLSSQIEGTQSSFSDLMLFEHHQKPDVSIEDVEEVSNYVRALNHGLHRLKNNFPLCLRLLREMHAILLAGSRGSMQSPGEFRRSQNWIGGSRPGNALFVPPSMEDLLPCLFDFENFLQDETIHLPVLIKIGLAHVQFETIHPFLDGNGRLGRLLITLMLCEKGMLNEPILYLSLYLKQQRACYYDLLQQVRVHGNWEAWLTFFLHGIYMSARQALHTAKEINTLFEQDLAKIETLGRVKYSCLQVFDYLKKLPQLSVASLHAQLEMTAPTARSALNQLRALGIVEEISGKKRSKIYVYRKYLNILEDGAEPL